MNIAHARRKEMIKAMSLADSSLLRIDANRIHRGM